MKRLLFLALFLWWLAPALPAAVDIGRTLMVRTNGALLAPTNFFNTNAHAVYRGLTNAGYTFGGGTGSGTFDFVALTNKPSPIQLVSTNDGQTLTNLQFTGFSTATRTAITNAGSSGGGGGTNYDASLLSTGTVPDARLPATNRNYTSIFEMVADVSPPKGTVAHVESYYGTNGFIGGGIFIKDTTSTATTNYGTVFPATGGGRWLRAIESTNVLRADWFGLHPANTGVASVDTNNQATRLQNAVDTLPKRGARLVLPAFPVGISELHFTNFFGLTVEGEIRNQDGSYDSSMTWPAMQPILFKVGASNNLFVTLYNDACTTFRGIGFQANNPYNVDEMANVCVDVDQLGDYIMNSTATSFINCQFKGSEARTNGSWRGIRFAYTSWQNVEFNIVKGCYFQNGWGNYWFNQPTNQGYAIEVGGGGGGGNCFGNRLIGGNFAGVSRAVSGTGSWLIDGFNGTGSQIVFYLDAVGGCLIQNCRIEGMKQFLKAPNGKMMLINNEPAHVDHTNYPPGVALIDAHGLTMIGDMGNMWNMPLVFAITNSFNDTGGLNLIGTGLTSPQLVAWDRFGSGYSADTSFGTGQYNAWIHRLPLSTWSTVLQTNKPLLQYHDGATPTLTLNPGFGRVAVGSGPLGGTFSVHDTNEVSVGFYDSKYNPRWAFLPNEAATETRIYSGVNTLLQLQSTNSRLDIASGNYAGINSIQYRTGLLKVIDPNDNIVANFATNGSVSFPHTNTFTVTGPATFNSSISLGGEARTTWPVVGGDGGSATNAVATISSNNVAISTAATNLHLWAGENVTLNYTNSPEGDVDVVIASSGSGGSGETGMRTNQFTTNVVGQAIVGSVLFGTNISITSTALTVNEGSANTLVVTNGNVGVGTSAPLLPFDIAAGSGARFLFYGSGGSAGYQSGVGVNLGQTGNEMSFFLGHDANFAINFATVSEAFPHPGGYTTKLAMLKTGELGIGVVDPVDMLTINKTVGTDTPAAGIVLSRYYATSSDMRAGGIFEYFDSAAAAETLAFSFSSSGTPNTLANIKMTLNDAGRLLVNGSGVFTNTVTATNGFMGRSNLVFHVPTNAPTGDYVLKASGTTGVTRWAAESGGGGGLDPRIASTSGTMTAGSNTFAATTIVGTKLFADELNTTNSSSLVMTAAGQTLNLGSGSLTLSGSAGGYLGIGGGLTYTGSGNNGNLATTVDTVQELNDAVDNLSLGAGGGATNAVTTISTNGTALTTAATNLNFWQGTGITITGTNLGGLVGMRFDAGSALATDAEVAAGYQPLDATLTAVAGFNTTAGVVVQTGTDTFTKRTLTGTANEVAISNGDGVSGNPTFSLPTGINATKIADGTVTSAEFQFIGGLTSDAQTQINTKAATATTITVAGTASEITSSAGAQDLSANRTWTLSLPASIDLGGKTSFEIPNAAAPTVDAFGEIAGDNNLWAASRGAPVFYDGTAAVGLIGALVSDAPGNGQVPTWNTGGTITWETPSAAGFPLTADTTIGTNFSGGVQRLINYVEDVTPGGNGYLGFQWVLDSTLIDIYADNSAIHFDNHGSGLWIFEQSIQLDAGGGSIISDTGESSIALSGDTITFTGTVAYETLDITSATIGTLEFEGATDDAFETTFAVTDPTADRTITIPNYSGEMALVPYTNTYGSAVINFAIGREATTNMAGALTITGISGFNATNYNWFILHCLPNGSDRTVTIPTEWRAGNGGTSYVVTNGTIMDLLVEAQIGVFTNASVKWVW